MSFDVKKIDESLEVPVENFEIRDKIWKSGTSRTTVWNKAWFPYSILCS